jgi:tetratricopeptide (TPR) repeat protein
MNKRVRQFFLAVVLTLFTAISCSAQWKTIDSLKSVLPTLRDTSRINCLDAICWAYLSHENDSALHFSTEALAEYDKLGRPQIAKDIYHGFVRSHLISRTMPETQRAAEMAIRVLEKNGNGHWLGRAYQMHGLSLWGQSKFEEALQSYQQAVKLFSKYGNEKELGETYAQMGALELQRGYYRKSIEYCRMGLAFWRGSSGFTETGFATLASLYSMIGDFDTALGFCREYNRFSVSGGTMLIFTGETYFRANEYDSAAMCYRANSNRTISRPGKLPNTRAANWTKSRMAEIYMEKNQFDSALICLSDALAYFRYVVDRNQIMWVLCRRMKVYEFKEDTPAAMRDAYELLSLSLEYGARQHTRDANAELFKLYEHLNPDSAYEHLKKYTELRAVIDSDQMAQRLAVFNALSQSERIYTAIARLNKEKDLQRLLLEQTTLRQYFFGTCTVLLIGIGVIAFRNISLMRGAETHELVMARNELRIQKFASEAMRTSLQEKASRLEMQALRAQMNPHFIFNSLNSINRFILKNDRVQASDYLTKFSKLVRLILQNSQLSLIPLSAELEGLDLYIALESVRFDHRFKHSVRVSPSIETSELKIPPLLIQPYVENAIWHGLMHREEGGVLEINITDDNSFLLIRIADNGIGRELAAALASKSATRHKSLGLRITADRIAALNAEDRLESTVSIVDLVHLDGSPAGTEVVIKIPMIYD